MFNIPNCLLSLVSLLIFGSPALASPSLTMQGRILKPDATPMQSTSVQFRVVIYSPGTEACVLYDETQTLNMSGSNGLFSLALNSSGSTRNDANSYTFDKVFSNGSSFSIPAASCATGTGTVVYTPGLLDERKVVVYFKDSTMGSWEGMPATTLTHSAYAMESSMVGGYPASALCRVANGSGPYNVAAMTPANYQEVLDLANGVSTQYMKASSNAGANLPSYASGPSTPAAGSLWYDTASNTVKFNNGTSTQTVSTSAGTITSITAGTGLSGGGSSGTVTLNLADTAVTAGVYGNATQTPTITVDAQGRITAATSTAITFPVSTVAGKTGAVTLDVGDIGNAAGKYFAYKPNNVACANQEILKWDTATSRWLCAVDSGAVTSVSATSPIFVSGTAAAPIVGIYAATTGSFGAVQLASNGGTNAGTVVEATDSRLSDSRAPNGAAGGDLSGTYPNPSLAATGVTAGTYPKVTVDAKGRVSAGSALVAADIPNLDTTKLTTGLLALSRGGTGIAPSGAPDSNKLFAVDNTGTAGEMKAITAGAGISVTHSAGAIQISTSGGGGTVTNVTSSNSYLSIVNGTTTPALTVNVGTSANTVAAGDDTRIVNAMQSGTSAGGDLSGTYPNPSVVKIQGFDVASTTPANTNFFKYNGTNWAPGSVNISDLKSSVAGDLFDSPNCSSSQTLSWSAVSDQFSCISIGSLDASAITTGTVAYARLPIGTAANTVAAGDDSRIGNALKIQSRTVAATAPTAGQVLTWNNGSSQWEPQSPSSSPLTSVAGKTGAVTLVAADISGLGTSAVLNVAASGDAASTEVVIGNDSRLTDGRAPTGAAGGDLTGTYPNPILADSGVTAGSVGSATQIPALTIDSKGRITSATINAISFPVSSVAGKTGSVTLDASDIGSAVAKYLTYKPNNVACADQQVLKWDNTNSRWACANDTDSSAGGFVSSVSVSAPLTNSGTATAPVLNISPATTSAIGAVQLAASGGTTAGTVVQANDTRLSDSRAPSGTAGGDLSGSFPNPTVAKIQGVGVTSTAPTSGQFFKYSGASWVGAGITISDLKSSVAGNLFSSPNCSASQTLSWSAVSDQFSCISIGSLDAAAISTGTIDYARLPIGTAANTVAAGDDSRIGNALKIQARNVAATAPSAGQVLTWNNGSSQWEPQTPASAPVTSVAGKTGVVTLVAADISDLGTVAIKNIAASGDAAATEVVMGNDTRLTNGRAPTGSASGDLSGTYPNPAVAKLQSRTVAATAPTAGQVLTWNNGSSQWEPQSPASAPVSSVAGKTGAVTLVAADISGLGTSAVLDVAASGDAAAAEVVMGNDSRLTDGRTPTGSAGGDLSGTYPNPTLTTSGVTAGGYGSNTMIPNLVIDAKGRITSASSAAISFPVSSVAGKTGAVTLDASDIGSAVAKYLTYKPNNVSCADQQVLKWDNTNSRWDCANDTDSSAGGFVSSVSVSAPLTNSGTATAPVLNISAATTSAVGAVQLAASGGTTAGTVVQATDARLSDSRAPNGSAGGDLSGTYPNPAVAKIQSIDISSTAPTSGHFFKYNGVNWAGSSITLSDLQSSVAGSLFNSPNCAANQTLSWSAVSDQFSCISIGSLDASVISAGTLADARLSTNVLLVSNMATAGTAGIAASNNGTSTSLARADHVHKTFYTLQWFFPGSVVAGVQVVRAQVPKGVTNCTITDSQITADTAGSTGSTFNIARCTAAGPACTSTANIYGTNVTLAASTESASGGAPTTATINAGDLFKVNLATVGTNLANVTVAMTYKCENTN